MEDKIEAVQECKRLINELLKEYGCELTPDKSVQGIVYISNIEFPYHEEEL